MHETQREFDKDSNTFVPAENEKKAITLPHTLKLKVPFEHNDKMVEEIVFKNRFKASVGYHLPLDMEVQTGNLSPVIQHMTGELDTLINELDMCDYMKAVGVVIDFLNQ